MSEPLEVLFVCTANICRSPVMELLAREMAGQGSRVTFASAGTHGYDDHPLNEDMAVTLTPGLGAEFRSRRLTREILADADLVLTAEGSHRTHILDEQPQLHRKVFTLGQFAATIAQIPGADRPRARRGGRRTSYPATSCRRHGRPLPARGGGVRAGDRHNHCHAGRDRAPPGRAGRTRAGELMDRITATFLSILAAGFFVGIVVGLTGMGGGALMTPALIFLGVGEAATVVTADLTAAAVYKTGGAIVHKREGSPNLQLAKWLMLGSIPMALLGPHLVSWVVDPEDIDDTLKLAIGFALLLAAATYALRLYLNLLRVRGGEHPDDNPAIRPVATLLVGALGGLLVGITSVGSGSVIMIALLMLYPGLSAVRLVGTDLVQAVPLVLAAAISNIALHGLDWSILIPLVLGSVPGTLIGSAIAPRVPQSFIRRGIVVVLTMSGVALLDKAGWAPLGAGDDETHPLLIAGVGLFVLIVLPVVWGFLRKQQGLPMFGSPTVAQLEDPDYQPGRGRHEEGRRQLAPGRSVMQSRTDVRLRMTDRELRPGPAARGSRRASSACAARSDRARRHGRRAGRSTRPRRRG